MKTIFNLEDMKKIMDLMEKQFGPSCEIVLHDLTKEYDSTIVDIRNGHVTKRKIGDCGSNLGLEVIRGTVKNGDRFNYITHARDGKILRSSTIYFQNEEGAVEGALCVNNDISDSLRLENQLHEFNQYNLLNNDDGPEEYFADNVSDLLDFFIVEGQRLAGKPIDEMTRADKIKMLQYLDNKGVFLITKSSEKICDVLGISKFTLYNYLDTLRNGEKNNGHK